MMIIIKVKQIMNHYRTFVSKNKIFQEFQKAYVEFQHVCDEYKKDGGITRTESEQIDKFIRVILSSHWSILVT